MEDGNNPQQNIPETDPMAEYNLAEQQRFIDMSNSENLPLNTACLTNQALSHISQTTPWYVSRIQPTIFFSEYGTVYCRLFLLAVCVGT